MERCSSFLQKYDLLTYNLPVLPSITLKYVRQLLLPSEI